MADKSSILSIIKYKRTKYHNQQQQFAYWIKKTIYSFFKLYIVHVKVPFRFNNTNRLKAKE